MLFFDSKNIQQVSKHYHFTMACYVQGIYGFDQVFDLNRQISTDWPQIGTPAKLSVSIKCGLQKNCIDLNSETCFHGNGYPHYEAFIGVCPNFIFLDISVWNIYYILI